MSPQRIQRRRNKGWRKPAGAIYVGQGSEWANPFALGSPSGLAREPAVFWHGRDWEYESRISDAGALHPYVRADGSFVPCTVRHMTAAESVECFRAWISGGGWPISWVPSEVPTRDDIRAALAGHDLMCWCPPDQPCHADLLLEIANDPKEDA